jgi:hypothetical protein
MLLGEVLRDIGYQRSELVCQPLVVRQRLGGLANMSSIEFQREIPMKRERQTGSLLGREVDVQGLAFASARFSVGVKWDRGCDMDSRNRFPGVAKRVDERAVELI